MKKTGLNIVFKLPSKRVITRVSAFLFLTIYLCGIGHNILFNVFHELSHSLHHTEEINDFLTSENHHSHFHTSLADKTDFASINNKTIAFDHHHGLILNLLEQSNNPHPHNSAPANEKSVKQFDLHLFKSFHAESNGINATKNKYVGIKSPVYHPLSITPLNPPPESIS